MLRRKGFGVDDEMSRTRFEDDGIGTALSMHFSSRHSISLFFGSQELELMLRRRRLTSVQIYEFSKQLELNDSKNIRRVAIAKRAHLHLTSPTASTSKALLCYFGCSLLGPMNTTDTNHDCVHDNRVKSINIPSKNC